MNTQPAAGLPGPGGTQLVGGGPRVATRRAGVDRSGHSSGAYGGGIAIAPGQPAQRRRA